MGAPTLPYRVPAPHEIADELTGQLPAMLDQAEADIAAGRSTVYESETAFDELLAEPARRQPPR
jgi:hypothetical protein